MRICVGRVVGRPRIGGGAGVKRSLRTRVGGEITHACASLGVGGASSGTVGQSAKSHPGCAIEGRARGVLCGSGDRIVSLPIKFHLGLEIIAISRRSCGAARRRSAAKVIEVHRNLSPCVGPKIVPDIHGLVFSKRVSSRLSPARIAIPSSTWGSVPVNALRAVAGGHISIAGGSVRIGPIVRHVQRRSVFATVSREAVIEGDEHFRTLVVKTPIAGLHTYSG